MKERVLIAGLGDTGVLTAISLADDFDVVGVSPKTALVSGQELGLRLARPSRWEEDYLTSLDRYRGLDHVKKLQGRIVAVDVRAQNVRVETGDGCLEEVAYDYLVVATGVSNGFWRDSSIETIDDSRSRLHEMSQYVADAVPLAIVGAGPSGVSSARNLAKRKSWGSVHLFFPGELPLPGYHPGVREKVQEALIETGVVLHPEHRAALPDPMPETRLGKGPVEWVTGQSPFDAECVLWTVGTGEPNTDYLPSEVLTAEGYVDVDEFLRVQGAENLFAIGDVADTDPNRSSARNWGYKTLANNIRAVAVGRESDMERFEAPAYRWGSIFGPDEDEGLRIFTPRGWSVRIPRWVERKVIQPVVVRRFIYGGVRSRD